jgi:hypothetical protein
MPTRRQLRPHCLRTNLWFECGPAQMDSWMRHYRAHGGFEPRTQTMVPLRNVARLDRVQFVLDSIVAAIEAGLMDEPRFLPACFESVDDWREFLAQLRCFDRYWVNERHFYAFLPIVGAESGCMTYPQLAASLAQEFAAAVGEVRKTASSRQSG